MYETELSLPRRQQRDQDVRLVFRDRVVQQGGALQRAARHADVDIEHVSLHANNGRPAGIDSIRWGIQLRNIVRELRRIGSLGRERRQVDGVGAGRGERLAGFGRRRCWLRPVVLHPGLVSHPQEQPERRPDKEPLIVHLRRSCLFRPSQGLFDSPPVFRQAGKDCRIARARRGWLIQHDDVDAVKVCPVCPKRFANESFEPVASRCQRAVSLTDCQTESRGARAILAVQHGEQGIAAAARPLENPAERAFVDEPALAPESQIRCLPGFCFVFRSARRCRIRASVSPALLRDDASIRGGRLSSPSAP